MPPTKYENWSFFKRYLLPYHNKFVKRKFVPPLGAPPKIFSRDATAVFELVTLSLYW